MSALVSSSATTTLSIDKDPESNHGSIEDLSASVGSIGGSGSQEAVPIVVEKSPDGRFERHSSVIGRGSFKIVYEAFDTWEGKLVAWSVVNIRSLTKKMQQGVIQEIKLMKQVGCKSPHLIVLYETWYKKAESEVVIINELCSGGSLNDFLRSAGTLRLSVLKKVMRQTLEGLSILHAHGAIHRDLKAENVYVQKATGDVRLGDYGLATISDYQVEDGTEGAKGDGSSGVQHRHIFGKSMVGTPCFMAPEVLLQSSSADDVTEYDQKVDIWSFGMMLIELITGTQPYSECKGMGELITRIQKGTKPQAFHRISHAAAKELIGNCLQVEPSKRPLAAELLKHSFFDKSTASQDAKILMVDMLLSEETPELRAKRIIQEAEHEAQLIIRRAEIEAKSIIERARKQAAAFGGKYTSEKSLECEEKNSGDSSMSESDDDSPMFSSRHETTLESKTNGHHSAKVEEDDIISSMFVEGDNAQSSDTSSLSLDQVKTADLLHLDADVTTTKPRSKHKLLQHLDSGIIEMHESAADVTSEISADVSINGNSEKTSEDPGKTSGMQQDSQYESGYESRHSGHRREKTTLYEKLLAQSVSTLKMASAVRHLVENEKDVMHLFDTHAQGTEAAYLDHTNAEPTCLTRTNIRSLINDLGLALSEKEFQITAKTLLCGSDSVSKAEFLAWWHKQALPYRKRAQLGAGLGAGIKAHRRVSFDHSKRNTLGASRSASIHKSDLAFGLSTFKKLEGVEEEGSNRERK